MSNDTMPCGCEGHADNASLCRHPALEQELAAAVTRAETAERQAKRLLEGQCELTLRAEQAERELARVRGLPEMEWASAAAVIAQGLALHARTDQPAAKRMMEVLDKAKTYVGRLKARAEQVERKRDNIQTSAAHWKERLERAEADNAALLAIVRDFPVFMANIGQALAEYGVSASFDCSPEVQAAISADHPGAALLEERKRLRADLAKLEESACGTCAPGDYATPEARKVAAALERMRALETGLDRVSRWADDLAHSEDCGADDDDPEPVPCECGKSELLALLADALKVTT